MSRTVWYSIGIGVSLILLVFTASSLRLRQPTITTALSSSIATSNAVVASVFSGISTTSRLSRYQDITHGIVFEYPSLMSPDVGYSTTAADEQTRIPGVRFFVPSTMATDTNLASDSYVSVEYDTPSATCTPETFLDHTDSPTVTAVIGGVRYQIASSTDAGAGNRYEQTVFVPEGQKCVAVRYYVHYAAIENYASGTVRSFDRSSLLHMFDIVRDSLVMTN